MNELEAQQATVKRLNDLTPQYNGRVQANAEDADAYTTCENDSDHGMATVVAWVSGHLFEGCADCGVTAIGSQLRSSDSGDMINIEVYR